MKPEMLPAELLFRDDGHLTDAGVVAIADAPSNVPREAHAHAESCEACALRVGRAALLALEVTEALGGPRAQAPSSSRVTRPLPVAAIGAALVLAAIGAIPFALDLPRWLSETSALAARALPLLARGALAAARGGQTANSVLVVSFAAVIVLLAATLALARASAHAMRQGVVR